MLRRISQNCRTGRAHAQGPTTSKGALSRRNFVAAGAVAAGAGFLPKKVFAQKKIDGEVHAGLAARGRQHLVLRRQAVLGQGRHRRHHREGHRLGRRHPGDRPGQVRVRHSRPRPIRSSRRSRACRCCRWAASTTTRPWASRCGPNSPIKAPADLKGKKVGSTLTSGEYPFLPTFLKNVGLTMADIQSISLDSKVREVALIEKQCDAITCFVASALPKIVAAGINPRVFLYSKYGLPFYAHSLTTTPEYFAKEKALCEAMTAGLAEGVKFALLNPAGDDRDPVQGIARAEARFDGEGAARGRHGRVVRQLRLQGGHGQGHRLCRSRRLRQDDRPHLRDAGARRATRSPIRPRFSPTSSSAS